jgi:hypothetical protein
MKLNPGFFASTSAAATLCALMACMAANGARAAGAGSSASNPLPPPTGYEIKPSGKGVEVIVIEETGVKPSSGGLTAPAVKLNCENRMKMGIGTGVPTIDPGYDEADPYTRVVYISAQGDKLVRFTKSELYRSDKEMPKHGADQCTGRFGRITSYSFYLRRIEQDVVQGWIGSMYSGVRHHTVVNRGSHKLLNLGPPSAAAGLLLGGNSLGPSQVGDFRCERWRFADGHESCSLVQQTGLPDSLVNWIAEITPVPGKPAGAQATHRLTRLQTKVWVDSSVFEPPPGAPYKEVKTGVDAPMSDKE